MLAIVPDFAGTILKSLGQEGQNLTTKQNFLSLMT